MSFLGEHMHGRAAGRSYCGIGPRVGEVGGGGAESVAEHGTAEHGTLRHSTVQHSTVQHSTVQHSTAQHSK